MTVTRDPAGSAVRRVRDTVRHAAAGLRGRDVSLWAAGLTFFAILATVPLLLIAARGAALLTSPSVVLRGARAVTKMLPDAHDGGGGIVAFAEAALRMPWWVAVVVLLPATFYGEGLRRAMRQVAGAPVDAAAGWKGRLGFLPVVATAPVAAILVLTAAPVVEPLYTGTGWYPVLGVVVSFHVLWVVVSIGLSLVFAVNSSATPSAAIAAGFGLGAVLSGFLHGFLLFLAILLDWDAPFAGLPLIGAVSAWALWLYLLHVVLLVGHQAVLSVAATSRAGRADQVHSGDRD
ncbi:YhjD/YihY/BrkB family envelope integrity protein [Actinokineospora sp. NBRC 105648]|uniref:YhjD/YihY/BrkB family envelope integrity protein n=1 Tax=Actinokineospora sp. NBRC 105648 TaxID=3032206 RepID=UPI0024A39765|nr:YhjD/YihY/BrkB family envelope integrity protein [Actinokineospora sp. NBRC 105648]GLZ40538.1 hypothetical protein Acsp05_41620 [Actinokineospora sp. NBRC 105648]